jgi:hypothetical protein
MFRMSVAACAAALGSFDVTVCGACVPPLGMALLVATSGEAGLPLGMAWLGTGEARLGGADVGTVPFAVAEADELVAVCGLERETLLVCVPGAALPPGNGVREVGIVFGLTLLELCGEFAADMLPELARRCVVRVCVQWKACSRRRVG